MWFCEAHLCAWIKTPGNAWSSFFHLAVGLYLWRRWRGTHPAMAVQLFATCAAIAFGSFFLHASMTFPGEMTLLTPSQSGFPAQTLTSNQARPLLWG